MTQPLKSTLKARKWYERYRNIHEIIRTGKDLPRCVQEDIGECLLLIAEEYWVRQVKQYRMKALRKPYLILTLYKNPQNCRWYADIPAMHNALNLMMRLPEFAMQQLDDQCLTLLETVRFERANLLLFSEEPEILVLQEASSRLNHFARGITGETQAMAI